MYRIWKPLALGVVIAIAMGASSVAEANSPANNNAWWGDGISFLAHHQVVGLHASTQEVPRTGVGNVSKTFAPLSEGGQGTHAMTVGQFTDQILGVDEKFVCTSPGNSGIIEEAPVEEDLPG